MKQYLTISNFIYTGCIIFLAFIAYSVWYFCTTPVWYYDGCSYLGYYNMKYETPLEHYGYCIVPVLPCKCIVEMPTYFLFPGLVFVMLAIVNFKLKFLDY